MHAPPQLGKDDKVNAHLKYLGKTAGPKDLLTTESQNKVNIGSTLP